MSEPALGLYQSVLNLIRDRRTPHPTNKDFSVEVWHDFFSALPSEFVELVLLEEFGERLYLEMSRIRELLANAISEHKGKRHRGFECLAYANAFVYTVESEHYTDDVASTEPYLPDFVVTEELKGVRMNLRPTMMSFVEAVHDGLRLPLGHFQVDSNPKSGKTLEKISDVPVFAKYVNELSGIYNCYEYLWGAVVWRGSRIEKDGDVYVITPINRQIEESLTIARHINEAEMVQVPIRLFAEWRAMKASERLPLVPPHAVLSLRKGVLKVHWDWNARNTSSPQLDIIGLKLTEDRIPHAVLKLVNPCPGVTAEDAMRVRTLLREIGFGLLREYRGAHQQRLVSLLSATLDKKDLCQSLQMVLGWTLKKIAACVELFTFSGFRSEVWYQPLVDLGSDRLGLALHPLCHGVPVRTCEWLLSCDKRKEGAKGHAFEDAIADYFSAAADSNKVAQVSVRKRLHTRNDVGDIDLLIAFEQILLVVECKCIVHPSTDNDYFNREQTIRKASIQATKKAAYVTANLRECIARYNLASHSIPRAIIPLVMVSGNEYVGIALHDNVLVVSKASMAGVIANYATTVAKIDGHGAEEYITPPSDLYSSTKEAVDILLGTIRSPPLIDFYRPYMKIQYSEYFSVLQDQVGYKAEYGDVIFDDVARAEYLVKMGLV